MAEEMATSTRAFALDIFHTLRQQERGNLFFSPFSITSALGMVYAGAGSSTSDEMARVMHFSKDKEAVHQGFRELLGTLKGGDNVILETANRVYIQDGYPILEEYMKNLRENYLSEVENADFADDKYRIRINTWVEEQTRQKIRDLLPPGSLSALTRLVLVNAIYFKGNWKSKFDAKNTKPMPFYLSRTEKADVPMMHQKADFKMHNVAGVNADIVEMDYKGKTMSMILVIPRDIEGLKEVEDALTPEKFGEIIEGRAFEREITLYLPKFKMESAFQLKEPLSRMGMAELFSDSNADLSGVTGNRDLYVSEGYHKAFLEVNEEGSEAAAATGMVMVMRAMSMKIEVKADRPFLLFIRDKNSRSVLFVGRMTNPVA